MADLNLKDIIRTSQESFDKIAAGTGSHTYDDENQYEVELAAPIILGAAGSGTFINTNNELVTDIAGVKVNDTSILDTTDHIAKLATNTFYGTDFKTVVTEGEADPHRKNVIVVAPATETTTNDFTKRDEATVGDKVITVKNLDLAVAQALYNHKSAMITDPTLQYTEDTMDATNPAKVSVVGNKTKACKTIGAIRRATVYVDGVEKQAIEVDADTQCLKMPLAETNTTADLTAGNFGFAKINKDKGLKLYNDGTNDVKGLFQIDETQFDDTKTPKINDILDATGVQADEPTRVLTTKFIDHIFKYGLGHFNENDRTAAGFVLTEDDTTTTPGTVIYGEKHYACKAIGAQREVNIRVI